MSFYQYVDFLLRERKSIEEKLNSMNKAEMIRFGRQLLATYEQSLKGFDDWFTNFYIMDKMDQNMIKEMIKNLINVGFQLLEYDRDVTKRWYDLEEREKRQQAEAEMKKKSASSIV
ncbi:MAG: DUF2153 family protein [Candidatus Bathyarchaeia archaeon]